MKSLPRLLLISITLWACLDLDTLSAQRRGARAARGPGVVSQVQWSEDGKSVSFTTEGQRYLFDLENRTKEAIESEAAPEGSQQQPGRRGARFGRGGSASSLTGTYVGRPLRGRQFTQCNSPDGNWEAHYEDWNLVLKNVATGEARQVTRDGDEHVHYGTASWVYGEELNQRQAMWWTPDSKKILFYKFDDRGVQPFYLVRGWSEVNTSLYPEYYPKAGAKNPAAELLIYDLDSGEITRVDVGGGSDEYIYGIRVSPGGDVMMVNWTDRLQQHLRVLAIDTTTGECRTIVEERQDTWQTNSPPMRYLEDNHRFLWPTDKSGYTHYELRDLDGNFINTVTSGDFQTSSMTVYEDENLVSFAANSCEANPYYMQFHLVGLDGSNHRRVTTQDYHHSNFNLSPDKQWLIAQYEEINTPPCTALYSTDGQLVAKIAISDPASAANVAEMFTFRSDDDKFDVYGVLYKPRDFDPEKSYPIINSLYGGPGSMEFRANYVSSPPAECNRGYLVVKVNNRGTGGRGKAFLSSTYKRLGDVDIQDHADAIRLLRERPYVDGNRVGIVGHSYGGYMAAMGIFKHPDVYTAAVDRAGPTDWRNYDTIYTERYMSTPQLNQEGYDVGRAMTYVKEFKGKLLIMHGLLDDNVHPNNAFQLIDALDQAGKPYESRFWPNGGHGLGSGSGTTQNDFFDRVLKPDA